MKKLLPFAALIALTFGIGLSGCKSPAEKACANLAELADKIEGADDEMKDEAKCVEQMEEMQKECGNGDEVLECFADVEGDDEEKIGAGILACALKCEKK